VFKAAALAACLSVVLATAYADDLPPPRDPMQPYARGVAGAAAVAGPRFVLTAVLISSERRVAIVNGKPYQSGENVDGVEIVRIESSAVHLREHGAEIVVPLGRAVPSRSPASQGDATP
jgi:predicted membrane protein